MVGISRLYCQRAEVSDRLRYAAEKPAGPVVVFNCTQRCNLNCVHCYSGSSDTVDSEQLSTAQACRMIDDLALAGVPVLLLSGGEPLLRPDIFELITCARDAGLRVAISTNGTTITGSLAEKLARADLSYAGISIDGIGEINDTFRGKDGAFDQAIQGIKNCQAAGVKVGLRMTLTACNIHQLPAVFDLIEAQDIKRACFYHLVTTGRGRGLDATLSHSQTRDAIDLIIDRTAQAHAADRPIQILTVDNHADGPYLYMRLLRDDPQKAETCLELLKANGGNATGERFGCVSWNGDVHADQFWRDEILGNVTDVPFSKIWFDPNQPLLAKLRDRKNHITGRCQKCRWWDICNGNLRARAASGGDPWSDDPGCYLTDEEISL